MTSTAPASSFDELVRARRSCRGFRPDPVDPAVVERIIGTALHAPSWCNSQSWHVHVIGGEAVERFRTGMVAAITSDPSENSDLPFPAAYEGVYRERRRATGWQLYEAVGVEKGDRLGSAVEMLRNFELFDAPHAAIITTDAQLGTYGAIDCGLFLQTFLLAAEAHGVATVAQAALASQAPFVRDFLGLGDDRLVVAGVSFGYADPEHAANSFRTPRQSLAEAATWVTD
ncbi:nitroreductase family protein [Aeromicrobium marinum DSM 15272]|uniref:Nitroreductase family protein n=1 Tax=Aeromicrobium marinum DSM 15272 TaxID=585531 RepID=E2SDA5_9ACTN|nr:nitroreductase [Aeromicrobium marinum]EFQ82482.1 nitroreductase family protein [Aeromicrobium marinum DSM 15272]